jgi:beta-galactosidase
MPNHTAPTPSLGVCYYPEHWDDNRWPADLRQMRSLGITYVRVGEFAWSRFEPAPGKLNFGWLQHFLDLAESEQIKVIVGTPTATPPKWLVDSMPEMLALDKDGLPLQFGSRRHYCFSHEGYRNECRRIVIQLAEAVGNHPAVLAWQIDNEFGCHGTALSYSSAARGRFQQWLQNRYHDVASLNAAWGNVFWSMEYRDFGEVELPNRTPTDPNPAHSLDFRRFSSDMIMEFMQLQIDWLRRLSPGRLITHNFMADSTGFDHFAAGGELDFASWDVYPLGFLASVPLFSDQHRLHYLRSGDPDYCSLHHDLYRACGRGRWWIMEQQPGPVNWAPYNPAPLPGMVRFWALEAFAHGAEVVSFFRWRQAPFAQEQHHAGLQLPNGEPDTGSAEVVQLSGELPILAGEKTGRTKVALVFDYEAGWAIEIQPQSKEFTYSEEVFRFYRAVRQRGLDVDIVPQDGDLSGYRLILVPSLPIVRSEFLEGLRRSSGTVLFGPRLGAKTENFQIPATLPPGRIQELIPLRVVRVDSLPLFASQKVHWDGQTYTAHKWMEHVNTDLEPIARYENGRGALFRYERFLYLTGLPDDQWLNAIIERLITEQKLSVTDLPTGVRTCRLGSLRFFFNYNPHLVQLESIEDLEVLVGDYKLPPAGVLIGRDKRRTL